MLGVTLLRRRELEEHVAASVVGVVGEPAEQRAARDLVGVHRLESLASLRIAHFRFHHAVTVPTNAHVHLMR